MQDVSKMYTVQCTVISHIIACALLSDIALCTLLSISPSMSLYIIQYTFCVPSMPYCLSCSHNAMWSLLTIGWGLFSTDMPGTHCQTHDEETCEKLFLGNIFSLPMFSSWFPGLHVGMGGIFTNIWPFCSRALYLSKVYSFLWMLWGELIVSIWTVSLCIHNKNTSRVNTYSNAIVSFTVSVL